MSFMAAVALWLLHGLVLWWNWSTFRPRLALLHGLGVAVAGGLMLWLAPATWLLYLVGAVIGGVGGWGHRVAPGLWVGIALLWPLPFVLGSAAAFEGLGSFAVAALAVAGLASLTRSAF